MVNGIVGSGLLKICQLVYGEGARDFAEEYLRLLVVALFRATDLPRTRGIG